MIPSKEGLTLCEKKLSNNKIMVMIRMIKIMVMFIAFHMQDCAKHFISGY